MKYTFFYSLVFGLLLLTASAYSSPGDSVKVVVLDEKDQAVSDVAVTVQGNPTFTTNKYGTFKFKPVSKLVIPFDVAIKKQGFELDEFSFDENGKEKELEIHVKKAIAAPAKDFSLQLQTSDKKILAGIHINYNGKNFTTDKTGKVTIPEKTYNESLLVVKGFKIQQTQAGPNRVYNVQLVPAIEEKPLATKDQTTTTTEAAPVENQKNLSNENQTPVVDQKQQDLQQQQLKEEQEKVFKQYEQDFGNLSQEIIAERERLMENNRKIRGEIERITEKLKNEKNLSKEQREKLRLKVENLEQTLIENTIAYNKAEEKTLGLIQNLKHLVMQKDSLNAITLKKLSIEEKKREIAEKKTKRTLYIFTIITISLVFLAVSFYAIARKMRNQRTALLKSVEELKKLKEQMGVKEVS